MMSFQRRIAVSFMSVIVFIVAVIFFFLFSENGSQFLWSQAQRWVPGLQGEFVQGSVVDGWELEQFQFHNDMIDVSAQHLKTKWRLASLLSDEALIDEVSADKLTIHLSSNSSTSNEEDQTQIENRYITTPIALKLNKLALSEFVYEDATVKVQLKQFDSAAELIGHDLHIPASSLSGVDVQLKPQSLTSTTTVQKPANTTSTGSSVTKLPPVFVPLNIVVDQLAIQDARYHQDGFDTGIFNSTIAASFNGVLLTIQNLEVAQNKRSVALNGKMVFQQNYPLTLNVDLQSDVPGWLSDARKFHAELKGDLSTLSFQTILEGPEKLNLSGKVEPLSEQIPFEVNGTWNAIPLPDAAKDLNISQGQISAKGSLKQYEAKLKSVVQWQTYPKLTVTSDLKGDFSQVNFKQLLVDDGSNHVLTTGLLNWSKGIDWKGESDIHLAKSSAWLPSSDVSMDGKLKQQVSAANQKWAVDFATENLKGMLNGYPLTIKGRVTGDQNMRWDFNHIALHSGSNQIDLNGRLAKTWDVAGKLQLPNLAAIDKSLQGGIAGDFQLHGPEKAPVLTLSATSDKLVAAGSAVRNVKLNGRVTLDEHLPLDVSLSTERIYNPAARFTNLLLILKGNATSHTVHFSVGGKQLATEFDLSGSLKNQQWLGQLKNITVKSQAGEWALSKPLSMSWKNQRMTLSAHCWVSQPTQLCFEKGVVGTTRIHLPFTLIDLNTERLEPWLPAPLEWQGTVAGQGVIGWQSGRPNIDVSFTSQKGTLKADTITAQYDQLETKLAFTSTHATLHFLFVSPNLGKTEIDAEITDPMRRKLLAGNFNVSGLKIDGVAPLVDALAQTKGTINGSGRFAGTLNSPLLYGQFALENGQVTTATELVDLTAINGRIVIEGDKADLNATMKSGKGTLQLNGRTDWPDGQLSGYLNVASNQMDVSLAGYGQAKADSSLQMKFDSSSASLTGNISIPWARILVKEIPDSGVALSDDVQVVRNTTATQTAKAPFPLMMDLDLRLGSDVQLDAMGLKAKLAGGMRLRQQPQQSLTSAGEIYVVNGRFKAYGQNLVIRSGKLVFNGDVSNPYLMAEAIRDPDTMEDSSVTVGVKINSPVNSINAQLFSEPDLPDTDKLSYLIRGRSSTATTNGTTEESMTAMMIGAGLGQANGVVSDVASNFGLKDAGFDTSGSGTDTQVNLSAYLFKNLQLQYGVGVYSAVTEVKMKYFFLPQLYLQAVTGTAQALDLFYKFEF